MKYFSIEELIKSDTAIKYNIDNTPTPKIENCLIELVEQLLDPFREAWGSPLKVNSGYRCQTLNDKITGASKTSAHMIGYAADLVPTLDSGRTVDELLEFTKKYLPESGLKWDQALLENSNLAKWLHLGLYNNLMQQRRQIKILNA